MILIGTYVCTMLYYESLLDPPIFLLFTDIFQNLEQSSANADLVTEIQKYVSSLILHSVLMKDSRKVHPFPFSWTAVA